MQELKHGDLLVGRYQIERLIGRGGMGAVYEARDTRLGNLVAVKQMAVAGQVDAAQNTNLLRAFEREARLLAHLRHPALAVVSDYFADGSGYYLVMQYIPGDDLAYLLKAQGGAFPVAEALRWADQILDALGYLHGQTPPVVHRDIKPQNLKLTPRGELILLDFGLAKGEVGAGPGSISGASLAGYTPLYAPFEQIQGSGTAPPSDLYALGATLYHLLTGQAPRSALDRAAATLRGEPDPLVAPRQLRPELSAALSDSVQHLMALDPARRPASAEAARRMLRQAAGSTPLEPLAGEPTGKTVLLERTVAISPADGSTVPVRPRPRPWRWLVAAVLAALLLGTGALLALRPQADPQAAATSTPTGPLLAVQQSTPTLAPPTAEPAPTVEPSPTLPPAPRPGLALLRSLRGPQVRVDGLAFAPDGTALASASDSLIRVWNPLDGELLDAFSSGSSTVPAPNDVAFSPDGLLLATGSTDEQVVKIRRAADGELLASFEGHSDSVSYVRFAPDGQTIASGSYSDNSVRLWRVSDGAALWSVAVEYPRALAFAPDGTLLTVARNDGTVELRRTDTGELLRELTGHLAAVDSLAFRPDGAALATGSFDGDVRIWDMATGETVTTLSGAGDTVRGVAFSPDGTLIVAGSADGFLRLYNVAEQRMLNELALGEITSMALSPDGSLVAAAVWIMDQGVSVHLVSTQR